MPRQANIVSFDTARRVASDRRARQTPPVRAHAGRFADDPDFEVRVTGRAASAGRSSARSFAAPASGSRYAPLSMSDAHRGPGSLESRGAARAADVDDEELEAYLKKLLHGEAFDRKGLIYGMGHAVYSLSDPREVVFKGYVEQLAHEKGRDKDLALYNKIEHMAPQLIAEERKIFKGVSPNVDFYSGFVYDMLGIPMELYTPLFAVARVMGWSAHRIEELLSANKIIRPAYKSLGGTHEYIRRNERE